MFWLSGAVLGLLEFGGRCCVRFSVIFLGRLVFYRSACLEDGKVDHNLHFGFRCGLLDDRQGGPRSPLGSE
ncbi:hypothetical protein M758_2G104800 [Ceratodon purpureus]|nr:hypothetical protein M758_2G104800 [Ceratodon purpureus]